MKNNIFKCFYCELELNNSEMCKCAQCNRSREFAEDICIFCERVIYYPINKIKKESLKLRKESK